MRRRLMNWLIILLGMYVLFALLLRWREPHMLYYPDRAIRQTPDNLGWKFDDITLTESDGIRINGWLIPALISTSAHPPPTLLFFHGNAGNISDRLDKLGEFRSLGVDVFIIDYRGYGRSEGAPNEQATYHDAQAAYEYLTKERHIDPRRLVLYGESLGAAVAVDLAAKQPVGGVILEEPFTSVADVGQKLFPFMPLRLLVRNKYDTLSKIASINAPLLIFHSPEDEVIPYPQGRRLLAAAQEPKTFVELHGPHNEAYLTSAPAYRNGLKQFLASLLH